MERHQMEEIFELKLEDQYLEDILEENNLTSIEVLMLLFDKGLIDDDNYSTYSGTSDDD